MRLKTTFSRTLGSHGSIYQTLFVKYLTVCVIFIIIIGNKNMDYSAIEPSAIYYNIRTGDLRIRFLRNSASYVPNAYSIGNVYKKGGGRVAPEAQLKTKFSRTVGSLTEFRNLVVCIPYWIQSHINILTARTVIILYYLLKKGMPQIIQLPKL